ncbi:MAG: acyl-CoA thioesterase domain-containing protein, partial [Caulobacterales bacterium]
MTTGFPTLLAQGDGRYAVDIDAELCVGPPGHAYLFGGLTLALALDAAADATGRPIVQGALQFVSFTPLGERLELVVNVLQAGRTLAQVAVTGAIRGRLVLQAAVALGERPGFSDAQWIAGPQPPPPQACQLLQDLPPQDDDARFLTGIEIRQTGLGDPARGRTVLWLRRRDGAPLD